MAAFADLIFVQDLGNVDISSGFVLWDRKEKNDTTADIRQETH
jgi:hypothetical protein